MPKKYHQYAPSYLPAYYEYLILIYAFTCVSIHCIYHFFRTLDNRCELISPIAAYINTIKTPILH